MRVFIVCWILLSGFFSQFSYALDASVTFATFKSPESTYFEFYLHIVGKSVEFIEVDSAGMQATVEVLMLVKDGENIVVVDKYALNSPVQKSKKDFLNLKRYALSNGEYTLSVELTDQNNKENKRLYEAPIIVDYNNRTVELSDITLLASYKAAISESDPMAKNGISMEPLPFNFFHKRMSHLYFYQEVYDSQVLGIDSFHYRYYVEFAGNKETKQSFLVRSISRKANETEPILRGINIAKLPSGNYHLVTEVRDMQQNVILKKKVYFQRSNPYLEVQKMDEVEVDSSFVDGLDLETLSYSLRAIAMQVPDGDVEVLNIILGEEKEEAMKTYLFKYWIEYSANHPKEAYNKYMEVARAVDKTFRSGFRSGFETDRGWIYLKYGRPTNIVTEEQEPSAPPYEIWFYDVIPATAQNNVRFLFYNPNLTTGGYQLLHSTCRGEIQNPEWEAVLYKGQPRSLPGMDNTMDASPYKKARAYFNDF